MTKHVADLRENLRRCLHRADANRNAGHLLDNTIRESLRLSQALKKSQVRMQSLKARRAESVLAQRLPDSPTVSNPV